MHGGLGIGFQELFVVASFAILSLNAVVPGLGDFAIGRVTNAAVSAGHRHGANEGNRSTPVASVNHNSEGQSNIAVR